MNPGSLGLQVVRLTMLALGSRQDPARPSYHLICRGSKAQSFLTLQALTSL